MKLKSTLRSFLALSGSAMLAVTSANATQFWDGGGGDANWNTAANWGEDTLPDFSAPINFGGTNAGGTAAGTVAALQTTANNDLTGATIKNIFFTNNGTAGRTQAFTLTGNSIILGTGTNEGVTSTAVTTGLVIEDVISLNIDLGSPVSGQNRQFTLNKDHHLKIDGVISGGASAILLARVVDSKLTLTNANNSYLGPTNIASLGNGTVNESLLEITSIANGGVNSSIGASSNAASNLRFNFGFNDTDLTTLRYIGGTNASTDRLFILYGNINGTNSRIESSGAGTLSFTNTGAIATGHNRGRNFYLGGTNTGDNTFAPTLKDFSGTELSTFTKEGVGKWIITGTHTYTGGTNVTGGTLTMNGSLGDATMSISNATVNGSGTLTYNVSGATIDLISVSTGGTLNAAGLTVNINGDLTESEYVLVDATGGGTISGTFAGLTNDQGYTLNYATANQVKLVSSGGIFFADWRTANSAGSQTLADDHDSDGVDNGTEFFLGGNTDTTGFTPLPSVVDTAGTLSVTWVKHPNYPGNYGTDFVVQTSETLADPWTTEPTPPSTVTISGNNVTYTFPEGPAYTGKRFARLKVTGPN